MGKQLHIQGDAIIQIAISETGAVKISKAISGSPILMPAAMEAIQQWQYSPFLVDGKPSAVQTTVTVPFSLGDSPEKIKEQVAANDLFFKTIDLCRKQREDQQLAQAETTCKRAITLSEQLDKARQLERLEAVRETGHALFLQKKFSEALESYQAEMRIAEKIFNPYDADLGSAQHDLGNGLWSLGRTEEAKIQYGKAEVTFKLASAHMDSAFLKNVYAKKLKLVLHDHAALLRQMGQVSEAVALEKQASDIVVKEGLRDE
jgi:tetratricopeptide (TPR) repeat protein